MTHERLWRAVEDQAKVWQDVDVVEAFSAALPRNASDQGSGLPRLLQELDAAGAWVNSRPLRAASSVKMLLGQPRPLIPTGPSSELNKWLDLARPVEAALVRNVAWLRSRLPGYPTIRLPQLEPNAPLTTDEFSWRLPWLPPQLRRGLQFQAGPGLGPALGTSSGMGWALDNASRRVAGALRQTEEWNAFESARRDLDEGSASEVTAARRVVRTRLHPQAVDAHEPKLALRRDAYRQAVVAEEITHLVGSARRYCDTFDAVDSLIEDSASEVFGQLVAYGPPQLEPQPVDLAVQGGAPVTVSFTSSGQDWIGTGQLMWLDDELVQDAVHVAAVAFSVDGPAQDVTLQVRARVLTGTGRAWPRPTT